MAGPGGPCSCSREGGSPSHSPNPHVILRRPRDEESGGAGAVPLPLFPPLPSQSVFPRKRESIFLFPPLPSWERIEVRVIGAAVGLIDWLRKALLDRVGLEPVLSLSKE